MALKNQKAAQQISQALTQLLLQEPFFGVLAMRLELIEDETIPTEQTNGKYIKYNPNFINMLNQEQIKSELIHEVQHCAKRHPYRRDNRAMELWNEACDYVINNELRDANYKLDGTWLLNPAFKGMSEEQVYSLLEQQPDRQKKVGQGQSACHGQVVDAQDLSNECVAEQEQNWKQAVLQAARQAQQYGKLPACAQAIVEALKNPVVDWRSVLRKFIENTAKTDFTWTRPNKRYLALNTYLPAIQSDQLPPIVVYQDTSGSRWSNSQIQFACNEIGAIINDARPERTYVLCGDTKVRRVDIFELDDPIKFTPKGGGGTAFEPIFKWVEEHEIEPCCFVGITDLEGSFPQIIPPYPVLWVCDQKGATAPFGEVVEIKL